MCAQNSPRSGGRFWPPLSGLNWDSRLAILFKLKALILGFFSQWSSRPLERSKSRGPVWRKALFHHFVCFAAGLFVGFTPFVPINVSTTSSLMYERQALSSKMTSPYGELPSSGLIQENTTVFVVNEVIGKRELIDEASNYSQPTEPIIKSSISMPRRLLIIVTPTYYRPLQAYFLSHLAHTLKLVPRPLLWIVVEMNSQSSETADLLRRTGVMYRHLVCNKNMTEVKDRSVHQRNVALSHIQTHRLDGIVYFADDVNVYSVDLFQKIREIRRFGTWTVPKLTECNTEIVLEGPICNGTQVIGWQTNDMTKKFRRFHADASGFAFNSTILWDPKRWHRPTLQPIRQIDTVKDGFQVSTLIEQIVEDEAQMEGMPEGCSRVMVWRLHLKSAYSSYPTGWLAKQNLDAIAPLA